jgi:broad specificity phosphatase PhoE
MVRHGSTGLMKTVLCGRMSGVHLNGQGINEAETLAWRLAPGLRASVIFASPMERAIETAAPLARSLRASIRVMPAFNECDFGDWTGLDFAALESRRDWKAFNERRCTAKAPLGESLFDVQCRAVAAAKDLIETCAESDIVVFTHADVIRSALCFFTAMPLQFYLRYSAEPASLRVLENRNGTLTLAGGRSSRVDNFL